MKTAKSWFVFNDIVVKKKVKVEDVGDYRKYENETLPTSEELDRILTAADLRVRTAIVLNINIKRSVTVILAHALFKNIYLNCHQLECGRMG